jgi:hypothetical protein
LDEHPVIASASSAVHSTTRRRNLRMPPNLCNASEPARGNGGSTIGTRS